MWTFLKSWYTIRGNESCGTHVHISIAGGYTYDNVIRVAQAAIYFEEIFDEILPKERRQNIYSKSNYVENDNLNYLSRTEAINLLQSCRNTNEIVNKFCPTRYYGWNFLNLIKGKGTIEFRRGPFGTPKNGETLVWVHIVRLFIKTCWVENHRFLAFLKNHRQNIDGLKLYLNHTEPLPKVVAEHLNRFDNSGFVERR